jgi:hypothetical protein
MGNGERCHFLFGGGGIFRGLVGPRSLSAFTRSQIAFWMSLIGAGAQPSLQALLMDHFFLVSFQEIDGFSIADSIV